MHAILRLSPEQRGLVVSTATSATPSSLQWTADDGAVIDAAFESSDTIRIRGAGLELRLADAAAVLTPFTGTYFFQDPLDGSAIFTSYETGRRYRVTAISGELEFEGAELLGDGQRAVVAGGGNWELAIEEFDGARSAYLATTPFDDIVAKSAEGFDAYLEAIAGWRSAFAPAAELAVYVLWSATVEPRGFLGRESILMSKHWMDKVWSWDHCFNALAVAPGNAALALDQLLVPFDHQDASGALPDSVAHSEVLYNFVKPPIHGWALARLREFTTIDRVWLGDFYPRLARWTEFWLESRRVAGHPLPHYQHGNDSGWDNSTVFDQDRLIESPDLAAFLIVQLEVLAQLADELDIDGAQRWRSHRDALVTALLGLWQGESFVAKAVTSGRPSSTGSLLLLLPIVATDHLPVDVAHKLAQLVAGHLTEYGLATQRTDTPEYEPDGYWRGPIWAPSTILIEDGLRRAGEVALADQVSDTFRGLCERSGFAENFDALTGAGLRDRAYTWTASAYLMLARAAEQRAVASRTL